MKQYHDMLRHIMDHGVLRTDRTGTGTYSVFGYQMRFNLEEGFPLLTSKRVPFKAVAHELLWFLKGDTNIKYLRDNRVTIWDEWADADGDLGPVYGKQWRRWRINDGVREFDQIHHLIERIKTNPDCRRLIVSAWNVADLPDMALAPCHTLFQFYVHDGKLSCQLYQRSADCFLGVPFNIASYALLTHMIAQVCGLKVGDFVHTFGDAHIYTNHINQVHELICREHTVVGIPPLPELLINKDITDIDAFTIEDFELVGYHPLAAIKAPVAV